MGDEVTVSKCSRICLIIVTYATMLAFGVVENLKGVTFPLIKDAFNASYDSQGYLVSFSWYGYVIFCLVSTIVVSHFGVKAGILSGYVFSVVGCIVTAFVPSFITIIVSLMVVWMGFGFWEVSNNALAQQIFTKNSAVYLNLMHFFYGVGAIIGPQVASLLVKVTKESYRGVYKWTPIPLAVLLILTAVTPFSSIHSSTEEEKESLSVWGAFKMPSIWLCGINLGFMEVIEFGASNWGALYYRDVYGYSVEKEGATFVSMFYVLFTISRLFSGYLIEKLGYFTSLYGSMVLVIIIYLIGFIVGKLGIWVIPLTGYFIGIMFPTYMCLMMKLYPENASMVSSVVIFISGATNGLIQLVIGYINEYIGNAWGFRCNVLYTLIPFILLLCVHLQYKRTKKELPVKEVASTESHISTAPVEKANEKDSKEEVSVTVVAERKAED